MPNTATPIEFSLHDDVRLLQRHGDVRSGSRGRVIGRFARMIDPTYVVRFEDGQGCAADVRPDEIVLASPAG